MKTSKEELIRKIEDSRKRLNDSIEKGEDYESVYRNSTDLDKLLELYIVSGF